MHEYLRDSLVYRYKECNSCNNRTEFTCIKCGFCWSCHWKVEKQPKKEMESVNIPHRPNPSFLKTYSEQEQIVPSLHKPKLIVDVFGNNSDPICDYMRCHHNFSLHGTNSHVCHCKHPQNRIVGV